MLSWKRIPKSVKIACSYLYTAWLTLSTNYILQAALPLLCISAIGWLVYLVGVSLIQSRWSVILYAWKIIYVRDINRSVKWCRDKAWYIYLHFSRNWNSTDSLVVVPSMYKLCVTLPARIWWRASYLCTPFVKLFPDRWSRDSTEPVLATNHLSFTKGKAVSSRPVARIFGRGHGCLICISIHD